MGLLSRLILPRVPFLNSFDLCSFVYTSNIIFFPSVADTLLSVFPLLHAAACLGNRWIGVPLAERASLSHVQHS